MKTWLRIVLVTLSVGGGFAGTSMTLPLVLHPDSFSHFLITACFFLLFGFVTASGLMFVVNWEKTQPLIVALALQIPYISSPLFTYKFGAGLPAFIVIGPPEEAGRVGLFFGWESFLGITWRFGFTEGAPSRIGINVAAAVMLVLLWRAVHAAQPTPQETSEVVGAPIEPSSRIGT